MNITYDGRKWEMRLISIAFAVVIIGFSIVGYFNQTIKVADMAIFALIYGMVPVMLHWLLSKGRHTGDPLLLPIASILVGIGLVFLLRLKPNLLPYQLAWCVIGGIGFWLIKNWLRDIDLLQRYKYSSGVLGLLLLLSTILFGVEIGGNKSWIVIGPIRFEPAEFAKILLVIFLAGYLGERRTLLVTNSFRVGNFSIPHPLYLAPIIIMWGVALVLLVFEKDLGAALLFYGTFLSMLYIASGRIYYIAIGLLLFVIGGAISYGLFPHVRVRFDIWLNPWADPDGRGFQIIQALFAFGTGGIFGTGLALGRPEYIPAVHTDFVFAAIGEELGFMGTIAVLLLYVLLTYRGFRAALAAHNEFHGLLAAGFSSLLALQTFVIIGGVTKFVPLTGVTLPFVSYGGSSMLTSFLILGLLHNISEKR
jgi:cell division protein FtsW (lipid II flippase)